jgi:alpha-tubulin suppressor-like RCC1 family protein
MFMLMAMVLLAGATTASGETLYSADMSTDPLWYWAVGWAYGTPAGSHDPAEAHTGTGRMGNNLTAANDGDYPNNLTLPQYAMTPAIDCSAHSGIKLRFYRWLGVDAGDQADIRVYDGARWTTIWSNEGTTINDTSWQLVEYDISEVARNRPAVHISWGIGPTDGSVTGCGWNIDDVMVIGGVTPPTARSVGVFARPASPVTITLPAEDDGQPDPPTGLSYTITSLPSEGRLDDPNAGPISSVPYALPDGGHRVIYTSDVGYTGTDSFTFKASDGGTAPDGGESNTGTISVTVWASKLVHATRWSGQDWRDETRPDPALFGNALAVAGGGYHSLAIKADGTVWACGDNMGGQLGDGTTTNRAQPVQVVGLSGGVAVAGGQFHSLALKGDGTVWTWGDNGYGQLGDGTTTSRSTAAQVPVLSGVIAVAAGSFHTLALRSDGTVWAWGRNNGGQIGNGTSGSSSVCLSPVQVSGLSEVTAIACGAIHGLALQSDGRLWAWGGNQSGQLGDGTEVGRNVPVPVAGIADVVKVAGGNSHSLAITSDGTVWAWGQNAYGQLGDTTALERHDPVQVSGLSGVAAVTAGEHCSLAVKSDGTLWAWGYNAHGQLGDGTTTNRFAPVPVSDFAGVTAVAAGSLHSLAVRSDGSVWAWGYNEYGQLGDGRSGRHGDQSIAAPVLDPAEVVAVANSGSHTLALKSDGTVWAWGYNKYGQLGDGTTTNRQTPIAVPGLTGVAAVSAGGMHSLVLKSDGTVWAWGQNQDGQVGDGTTVQRNTPVQVSGLTDVVQVEAGGAHNLALKSDGTAWAWGNNSGGPLGDGTMIQRSIPVQVSNLTEVVTVAAGGSHSLAVKADGTAWAWGSNYNGQLGDGTAGPESYRKIPVQVPGLTDVVAVDGGTWHSLAVTADGTAWAWGDNYYGKLGDGTTTHRRTAVRVTGLSDVVAVAGGMDHSLAVRSDGTAWAWGGNSNGELGNGTKGYGDNPVPVQVIGLSGVVGVSAGSSTSVLLADPVAPQVVGTWPADGGIERAVGRVIVSFDPAVTNVSPDDLVLSGGAVTGVEGGGPGPYLFTVTGVPAGKITATIGGDIRSAPDGLAVSHTWTFQVLQPGDVDGDGHVDMVDLLYFADAFASVWGEAHYDGRCDLNSDKSIDVIDLLILVDNLGT